jgi:hypothetical protein
LLLSSSCVLTHTVTAAPTACTAATAAAAAATAKRITVGIIMWRVNKQRRVTLNDVSLHVSVNVAFNVVQQCVIAVTAHTAALLLRSVQYSKSVYS